MGASFLKEYYDINHSKEIRIIDTSVANPKWKNIINDGSTPNENGERVFEADKNEIRANTLKDVVNAQLVKIYLIKDVDSSVPETNKNINSPQWTNVTFIYWNHFNKEEGKDGKQPGCKNRLIPSGIGQFYSIRYKT